MKNIGFENLIKSKSEQNEQESFYVDMDNYKEKIKGSDQELSFKKIVEIYDKVEAQGGKALLVGGSVRDLFFSKLSKDYDLEVYGLSQEELKSLIDEVPDIKVSEVGKSFGIIKVFIGNMDIDISLPRKDSKTGEGHTGFEVQIDKDMPIKEAARRRDFTINTLLMDPKTGEIHNYFGGVEDAKNRILRVTDAQLFKDDSLRVLRAMQFAGRFALSVADDSREIIRETALKANENSAERFYEEFSKLFLKSEKPSLGLKLAQDLGIFEQFFPHFLKMSNTPQDPKWHPEGDVWVHTLMVVDEAARSIRDLPLDEDTKMTIMLSALLHDVGKVETTTLGENNRIISHGHDKKGVKKAEEFLEKIKAKKIVKDKVLKLVSEHMLPGSFFQTVEKGGYITDSAIRRLATRLYPATIEELTLLSRADFFGCGVNFSDNKQSPADWLLDRAKEINVSQKKPEKFLTGKDLIGQGIEGGSAVFGQVLLMGDRLRSLKELLSHFDSEADLEKAKNQILAILVDAKNSEEALDLLRQEAFSLIKEIREKRDNLKEKKS